MQAGVRQQPSSFLFSTPSVPDEQSRKLSIVEQAIALHQQHNSAIPVEQVRMWYYAVFVRISERGQFRLTF